MTTAPVYAVTDAEGHSEKVDTRELIVGVLSTQLWHRAFVARAETSRVPSAVA